jgi:type IV pilus assembly protein PilO
MINFDELKSLNWQDPGSWPWSAKILSFCVIFLVVVLLTSLLDTKDQWDELQVVTNKEDALKATFLEKKKQAVNLDLIKKQLDETQESLGALLKQLPNKPKMDELLTDINQAGLGRGLQFELFRPGTESVINGSFVEQAIVIRVSGDYDDLGKFASDISMLPRIVSLNDVGISPSNSGLTMDATAKTYRYLDENELASQKKGTKAAGSK